MSRVGRLVWWTCLLVTTGCVVWCGCALMNSAPQEQSPGGGSAAGEQQGVLNLLWQQVNNNSISLSMFFLLIGTQVIAALGNRRRDRQMIELQEALDDDPGYERIITRLMDIIEGRSKHENSPGVCCRTCGRPLGEQEVWSEVGGGHDKKRSSGRAGGATSTQLGGSTNQEV